MSKSAGKEKQKKPVKRTPGQSREMTELTEQELERVQGGGGSPVSGYIGETEKAVHQM